jgi:hypothetical protein
MFYSALGSTSSGSLLLSKTTLTSSYKIAAPVMTKTTLPQPDWSVLWESPAKGYQSRESMKKREEDLLKSLHDARRVIQDREQISEAQTAQIIIQHLELTKMIQSLEAKDTRKKSNRTVLFPGGFGRHLTAPEFVQQLEEQKKRKQIEAEEKAQRLEGREARKVAKAAAAEEWSQMVGDYETALQNWKADCSRLKAAGVRTKDWPAKPKRPRKPKLPKPPPIGLADGEEEGGDDFGSGREE